MSEGPILRTERLELRPNVASDLDGLVRLLRDEETRRFLGPSHNGAPDQFAGLMRNAGSWRLYGYGGFAVRKADEDELIASCGVFHSWRAFGERMQDVPEAGWIVRHDHTGQGIAREAMEAILGWFDEAHGIRRIACMIEKGNVPSERLAARLGFAAYGEAEADDDGVLLTLYERHGPPAPKPA